MEESGCFWPRISPMQKLSHKVLENDLFKAILTTKRPSLLSDLELLARFGQVDFRMSWRLCYVFSGFGRNFTLVRWSMFKQQTDCLRLRRCMERECRSCNNGRAIQTEGAFLLAVLFKDFGYLKEWVSTVFCAMVLFSFHTLSHYSCQVVQRLIWLNSIFGATPLILEEWNNYSFQPKGTPVCL